MVRVIDFQNLLDLTIQCCGKIEHLVEFAVLNNLEITQKLDPGTMLEVPIVANEIKSYFEKNNLLVATDYSIKKDEWETEIFPISF